MVKLFELLSQYRGYLCQVGRMSGDDSETTRLLFWGTPHSFENNLARALQFIPDLGAATEIPLKAGLKGGDSLHNIS